MQTYRVIACEAVVYERPGGNQTGRLTIDTEIVGRPAAQPGWVVWVREGAYIRAVDLLELHAREVGR